MWRVNVSRFRLEPSGLVKMGPNLFFGVHLNLKTAISFLCLMLVASCGGGGGKSVNKIQFSSDQELTAENPPLIPDYSFRNGMGLLLIKKSGSLSVCTSFLVGPKLLMTNSHCLSDISLTQKCSENVAVHVKSQDGFQFRKCNRIISRSEIGGETSKPDFAVIELNEEVSTTPMSISREGVVEGAELTIESVDYTMRSETLYGKKKISKCTPHTNSALGNYAVPKSSIIPLFGDSFQSCKIIKGNSGSPVFNSANNVVSVLFATIDREQLARNVGRSITRNMGLATNLACIRTGIPSFDAQRSFECDKVRLDEATYFERLSEGVKHGGKEERKKKAELMSKLLPSTFQFDLEEKKVDQEGMKYTFSFNPRCMTNPSQWSEEEKLKIKTDPLTGRRYATNISNYAFAVKIAWDEFMRPIAESSVVTSGGYELIVENIDQGGTSILVKIATNSGSRVVTSQKIVPLCR